MKNLNKNWLKDKVDDYTIEELERIKSKIIVPAFWEIASRNPPSVRFVCKRHNRSSEVIFKLHPSSMKKPTP